MVSKIKVIEKNIEQALNYLEQYLPLANVHMVDYFTKNVYKNYIPAKIQEEITKLGYKEVINKIFNNDFNDLPNLHNFTKRSQELTLKNLEICLKTQNFQDKLTSMGCSDLLRLKLNIFMTSKKSHEVDILSYIAAALKNISGTTHLIDIGDGKGYLSSMLALHHKIPILGVDSSEINTTGAVTRVKKLSRVWNSEVHKRKHNIHSPVSEKVNILNKKEEKSKGDSEDLYKQITQFVDESMDFVDIITNVFLETPNGLGLVGLHTCGNLATTSLRIFGTDENIKTICNVGCCYHFLNESFENEEKFGVNDRADFDRLEVEINNQVSGTYGFPMSNFLQEKRIKIGRAARMLAAQSIERILDKKELPNETLFYRALFEILLDKKFENLPSDKRQVGRFRKKAEHFNDYTRKALNRLNLNNDISDLEIHNLLEEYKEREHELYVFFLIRNMLAPVIEGLILLDRLLYLHELGIETSYLVQLFDPVVSPRCYGLIAMK